MGVSFRILKKLDRFSVDMEYSFEEGVLVIQGESGAGKNTVLNCIAGLKKPDAGRIIIDGRIVFDGKTDVPVKKRQIGYLFQNYALFPNMTVAKNIIYGIKNKEAKRLVGLRGLYYGYFPDYPSEKTVSGQNIRR